MNELVNAALGWKQWEERIWRTWHNLLSGKTSCASSFRSSWLASNITWYWQSSRISTTVARYQISSEVSRAKHFEPMLIRLLKSCKANFRQSALFTYNECCMGRTVVKKLVMLQKNYMTSLKTEWIYCDAWKSVIFFCRAYTAEIIFTRLINKNQPIIRSFE